MEKGEGKEVIFCLPIKILVNKDANEIIGNTFFSHLKYFLNSAVIRIET